MLHTAAEKLQGKNLDQGNQKTREFVIFTLVLCPKIHTNLMILKVVTFSDKTDCRLNNLECMDSLRKNPHSKLFLHIICL